MISKPIAVLYLILLIIFSFIRFDRIISDEKSEAKTVLVPYRNYFFVNQQDESDIYNKWYRKNGQNL
jgi:hypothetical protein